MHEKRHPNIRFLPIFKNTYYSLYRDKTSKSRFSDHLLVKSSVCKSRLKYVLSRKWYPQGHSLGKPRPFCIWINERVHKELSRFLVHQLSTPCHPFWGATARPKTPAFSLTNSSLLNATQLLTTWNAQRDFSVFMFNELAHWKGFHDWSQYNFIMTK